MCGVQVKRLSLSKDKIQVKLDRYTRKAIVNPYPTKHGKQKWYKTTIPKELAEKLHIEKGSEIVFLSTEQSQIAVITTSRIWKRITDNSDLLNKLIALLFYDIRFPEDKDLFDVLVRLHTKIEHQP